MKLADVIRDSSHIVVDESFADSIEGIYSCKLPEAVKRYLCIPDNDINYEEQIILRKLSNEMILDASVEMNCDFIGSHLLPLFDCGDNDYLCFDYSNLLWCMYNIVDDSSFNRHTDILDLL